MAHIKKDDLVLVDWTTGDPEGDRKHLFQAYRDFLKEIKEVCLEDCGETYVGPCTSTVVLDIFKKWKVEELNVDDFPRISIERPKED